jgi:ribosomal protein L37AE/L43A
MAAVVRISDQDKQRLEQVQNYLYRNGSNNLQQLKEVCPKCGKLMDGFRLEAKIVKCSNCGYEERGARLTGVGAFALGVIVAFGVAALADYLSRR